MKTIRLSSRSRLLMDRGRAFLRRSPNNDAAYRVAASLVGCTVPRRADLDAAGLTSAQLFDFAVHNLCRGSATREAFLRSCSRIALKDV